MDLSGNKNLLDRELVAFFASRTSPPEALELACQWAHEIAKTDRIVISGFHSPIERAVLDILLAEGRSVVVTLGRTLYRKIPAYLQSAFDEGRVLFVSFRDYWRPSFSNSQLRNWLTADLAAEVYFTQFDNTSSLSTLHFTLDKYSDTPVYLICQRYKFKSKSQRAAQMTLSLRKYLNNPDMLFRRVRDEHGMLHLSKRAKAYHPGQGVYRSSYKNARRLAATETNMAYRSADYQRNQSLDFVVGIRIKLSNNHTLNGEPFIDICDWLSAPNGSTAISGRGCYPKDFKFTGWHPLCRCFIQTIHKTREEIAEDARRIRQGLSPLPPSTSKNYVGDVPDEFKAWCKLNAARVERAKSLPYFIRDNRDYYDDALNPRKKTLTPLEVAKHRHEQRTPEQIESIKNRWQQSRIKASFSPEIIANNSVLNNTLPVSQGQPMTFREADEMRANPLYSSPDAGTLGYKHNCQTCTVAYELRRRGYNVEARPNPILKGKVREVDKMPMSWTERYLNTDGTAAKYQWSDTSVRIGLHKIKWIDSCTTGVGRYEVYCAWKGGGAHVFIVERQKNGNLLWFDPQSGRIGSEIRMDYIGAMKGNLIGVMRIDDKLINPQFSSRFIEAR